MIKTVHRFNLPARVALCCGLIISLFAEPTATASGAIERSSREPGFQEENYAPYEETMSLDHAEAENADLKWRPDVKHFGDYQIETTANGSNIAVIAIHGGKIEPGTTELAYALSSYNHYNYYSYRGVKKKGNAALHIASDQFDEPAALELVAKIKGWKVIC